MIKIKKILSLILVCKIFMVGQPYLFSQDGEIQLDAKQILSSVRNAYGDESQTFRGEIRPRRIGFKLIPLSITLSAQSIRLEFFESNRSNMSVDEVIKFDFLDRQCAVTRIRNSISEKITALKFKERIRNTDLTYEDLAMRFIEWPDPKIMSVEKAKGGKAWKIRCTNPDPSNGYSFVDAWISQRSGALVRMNGYNPKNQLVKSFEVDSVQQHKGKWYLEMMNVRTYPEGAKSKPTSSFLKLEIEK
jgi:hypothetical protein